MVIRSFFQLIILAFIASFTQLSVAQTTIINPTFPKPDQPATNPLRPGIATPAVKPTVPAAQVPVQLPAGQTPATQKPLMQKPAKPAAGSSSSAGAVAKPAMPDAKKPAAPAAKASNTKLRTELLLPQSTKAWISVPNVKDLEARFNRTQFGALADNKSLKPFADSLKQRVRELIDSQNVRLNLDIDQIEGVNSGEICFAGVLPAGDAGQHGIVFLMNVTDTRDKAVELSKRITEKLIAEGAVHKQKKIQEVQFDHAVLDKPKLFRTPRNNFKAIVDVKIDKSSWMLVSNNEAVFRDVLRRLTAPQNIQAVETLAANQGFKSVMEKTSMAPIEHQLRWFVDPFGYMELAERIRDDEAVSKVPRDAMAKKMAEAGFDAFRGIGGHVAIMTGQHEILHRTFVYAQRGNGANSQKVFDLFDFKVAGPVQYQIPRWVPADSSAVISGTWNTQKALGSFGHFYDALIQAGSWERTLIDLKHAPNLNFDLEGVVEQMANRFVIVSAVQRPISTESERVIIGCLLKGEAKFVFDSLGRVNPDARIITLAGQKVIEIDSTREVVDPIDIDIDIDIDIEGDEEDEEEDEEEERFQLFQKRYITVLGNEIVVCNDKKYLRTIMAQKQSALQAASDYQQIQTQLSKLVDDSKVAWRQFGRLDLGLETNYEMMRRGEMGSSQTMLARVVNRMFAQQAAEKARLEGREVDTEATRKQQLQGEKLPEDFAKFIAPYLGPTGGALEIEDDGWRMTGMILKKGDQDDAKTQSATKEAGDSKMEPNG